MALTAIFVYHGGREAFGWFGGEGWSHTIETWTASQGLPYIVVAAAIVAQLVVAVSLFVGFLTRLAGLIVVVLAGVTLASLSVVTQTDVMILEFYSLVLVVGFSLAFIGGGYFSVDRGISNNLLPNVG